MTIDSLDLIVSVGGSRNDYYKPENLNECRITYVIRHIIVVMANFYPSQRVKAY